MWEQVLTNYCERDGDPGFWAEPLNAVSNAAFLIAGFVCLAMIAAQPRGERSVFSTALAALVVVIGVGSFLFHTFATRWAGAADVIPIMIFMFSAVYFFARRFLGAPIWVSWLAMALFFGLIVAIGQLAKVIDLAGLGGSISYLPALLVLLGAGVALIGRDHPAGPSLLGAGVVFAASLTLRTIDQPYCAAFSWGGAPIGTHFLWHIFNGVTLFLVTSAAVRHGGTIGGRASSRPRA